jgi:hypothetical protein
MQLPEWIRQMAMRRTTRAADTLEGGEDLAGKPPKPPKPPEGPVVEPEPDLPEPPEGGGEDLQPGLPGSEVPQCDPGTPGYMQGIAERPETEEEHNARLGTAAGTVVDVGYLMGTAPDPRPNWPAMPLEVPRTPEPATEPELIPPAPPPHGKPDAPELEMVMKPVEG